MCKFAVVFPRAKGFRADIRQALMSLPSSFADALSMSILHCCVVAMLFIFGALALVFWALTGSVQSVPSSLVLHIG